MSCGVGHRRGLDLALLWLWCRPAAVALIQRLAWESPYTVGVALKRQKTNQKNKQKKTQEILALPIYGLQPHGKKEHEIKQVTSVMRG